MVFISNGVQGQIFATLLASLGAVNIGTIFGSSWPGILMFVNEHSLNMTSDTRQNYFSMIGAGATIGALPTGQLTRTIGYRYSMMLSELFVVSGWAFLIAADGMWMMNAGRMLQGVGAGALSCVIPSYVAEISQPHIRGRLGSMFQMFLAFGVFYAYLFGLIVNVNYVWYYVLCGVWTVVHAIGVLLIPDTPYYLLSKDMDDEAIRSMNLLHGDGSDAVAHEFLNLKIEFQQNLSKQQTCLNLFMNHVNCEAIWIGICCMFFLQLSGINYVVINIIYILRSFNNNLNVEMSVIIVALTQLIMSLLTIAIIDKISHRLLLIVSAVLMAISILCVSFCFEMEANYSEWVPLLYICIYIAAFSLGFGPLPWIIIGEIFSNEFKSYGMSIVITVNGIMLFILVYYFSIEMSLNIGFSDLFALFFVFCIIGATFVWIFIPETSKKTFAEIQLMMSYTGDNWTNNNVV